MKGHSMLPGGGTLVVPAQTLVQPSGLPVPPTTLLSPLDCCTCMQYSVRVWGFEGGSINAQALEEAVAATVGDLPYLGGRWAGGLMVPSLGTQHYCTVMACSFQPTCTASATATQMQAGTHRGQGTRQPAHRAPHRRRRSRRPAYGGRGRRQERVQHGARHLAPPRLQAGRQDTALLCGRHQREEVWPRWWLVC